MLDVIDVIKENEGVVMPFNLHSLSNIYKFAACQI